MKTRLAAPSDLVDIARIKELKGIKVFGQDRHDRRGDHPCRGRRRREAQGRSLACDRPPGGHLIGDPHVRHKGTIGGSIANNDPAADYPAALLALNATIVTNKRSIAAEKFFAGLFETALKEGEIITAVSFTAPDKAGYEKFRNPASRYAIVGVFVAKGKDGVRVAVTGAGDDGVFRAKDMEAALVEEVRSVSTR